jgi:hypothetical protein
LFNITGDPTESTDLSSLLPGEVTRLADLLRAEVTFENDQGPSQQQAMLAAAKAAGDFLAPFVQ